MGKLEFFDRDIAVATRGLSDAEISRTLAAFARSELAKVIATGEASPVYERYVNSVRDAAEESVKPPGPILYNFLSLGAVVVFALEYLRDRSPIDEGTYRKGHFAAVDGVVVTDATRLQGSEEVTISNTEPYARKIEVGHMRMRVEPGVYQDAQKAVKRQFPGFEVRFRMMTRPGGYVLKGRFRRGYRPKARDKLKKDTMAGAQMTYPALVISAK